MWWNIQSEIKACDTDYKKEWNEKMRKKTFKYKVKNIMWVGIKWEMVVKGKTKKGWKNLEIKMSKKNLEIKMSKEKHKVDYRWDKKNE